jgi:hypothetical protein
MVKINFIFIRYNPDNKKSDLNILLETINNNINLTKDDIHKKCNNYGYYVEYLYYDNDKCI